MKASLYNRDYYPGSNWIKKIGTNMWVFFNVDNFARLKKLFKLSTAPQINFETALFLLDQMTVHIFKNTPPSLY